MPWLNALAMARPQQGQVSHMGALRSRPACLSPHKAAARRLTRREAAFTGTQVEEMPLPEEEPLLDDELVDSDDLAGYAPKEVGGRKPGEFCLQSAPFNSFQQPFELFYCQLPLTGASIPHLFQ